MPGPEPHIIQSLVSHYADYGNPAPKNEGNEGKKYD